MNDFYVVENNWNSPGFCFTYGNQSFAGIIKTMSGWKITKLIAVGGILIEVRHITRKRIIDGEI